MGLGLLVALAVPVGGGGHGRRPSSPRAMSCSPSTPRAWTRRCRHVDYPKGSATVLLFFLSGCPTCHKMIPEWNRAFERRPPKLNVIGVLMDHEPPGFFQATRIAFPVVRSPGREFLNAWKVHRAPLTVRVGPGGKVEEAQTGIIDPIRLGEIFRP